MDGDIYRFPESQACWMRRGDSSRTFISAAQYAAMGSPPVVELLANDWFWGRVSANGINEVYRKVGETNVWILASSGQDTRRPVRRWLSPIEYTGNGSPPYRDISAANLFWSLPTQGATPPA